MTSLDPRASSAGPSGPRSSGEGDPNVGSSGDPAGGVRRTVVGYIALTKPRIIELLLITTIPTMFLAADGMPGLGLVAATLVGGALSAGGANALNCYLDRDIDAVMARTGHRPSATGQVSPRSTLVFGLALSAASVAWFALLVNTLAAVLSVTAIVMYVVGYTMLLKRRTPQNIVWGGAAGCMPVLIGWVAVTDAFAFTPFVLFGIVFFWTPPHYWPLSLRFRDDYASAGIPMLPVVATPAKVAGQIIRYSWAMVAISLLLSPVAHMSPAYTLIAIALGAGFLVEAYALRSRVRRSESDSDGTTVQAMRLFHGSITYLSLLFLAVAIDPFLPF